MLIPILHWMRIEECVQSTQPKSDNVKIEAGNTGFFVPKIQASIAVVLSK